MRKDSLKETLFTPHFGVSIDGFQIPTQNSQTVAAYLRKMLDQHLVVVVRNQSMSASQLRDLVAHFGPLFCHHADEGVIYADGLKEVLEMRKEPDGERLFGGSDWHADVTFEKPAAYVSALHAKVIPSVGGDTGFANTIAAYAALSSGMQAALDGLAAVHSYDGPGQPDHPSQTAIHPVIRQHPISNKKGIYINRMFATRFLNMTEDESRPLINFLDHHISRPEFTFRHRWSPFDLVLWDNRFTLHYPVNDFTGHSRLLIRCTALES